MTKLSKSNKTTLDALAQVLDQTLGSRPKITFLSSPPISYGPITHGTHPMDAYKPFVWVGTRTQARQLNEGWKKYTRGQNKDTP